MSLKLIIRRYMMPKIIHGFINWLCERNTDHACFCFGANCKTNNHHIDIWEAEIQ